MRDDVLMYFDRFYEIKGVDMSDKQAYFDTESWWLSNYGFQKYTSFGSFRVMKYRYIKYIHRRANEQRNKEYNKVNV